MFIHVYVWSSVGVFVRTSLTASLSQLNCNKLFSITWL